VGFKVVDALGRELKILIADDDDLLRQLLDHRLRASGYDVLVAEDGQQALDMARSQHPDLIVLDAMMPVLDGFAVLNALQDDAAVSHIPVLMLTALRGEKDIVGALSNGAADYMVKPFLPDELNSRITRILAKADPT
jgi:DNA-binding response OmpR family regulator